MGIVLQAFLKKREGYSLNMKHLKNVKVCTNLGMNSLIDQHYSLHTHMPKRNAILILDSMHMAFPLCSSLTRIQSLYNAPLFVLYLDTRSLNLSHVYVGVFRRMSQRQK